MRSLQQSLVLQHQREPDALWYIVNQFLSADPEDRHPVLRGKDQDVEAFAESAA